MSGIILCNISDSNQILLEKRIEWVYNVLDLLEIPQEISRSQNIFDFRGQLNQYGIYIETKHGGEEIDIYKCPWYGSQEEGGWLPLSKKYLIAQWKLPKYIRKIENKDVYYELHLNEWSMLRKKG